MSNEVATQENFNPFANAPVAAAPRQQLGASAQAEVQRAIAEVQAEMLIAKQFPRDRVSAVDLILNECTREKLAQQALYSYSRGGTEITGPSIRLAEAIAQNWGNIDFGWNEVSRSAGVSEIVAFCWDKETNVRRSTKFYVKHIRNTKRGSYALEDERDIYELCANQAARRMRACILNTIPGDVVDAAIAQCEATLKTKVQITPERINAMVEAFAAYGVTKAQLEARIQKRMDAINGPQMVSLGKIYNSLKEGMSVAADWFDPEVKEEAAKGDAAAGAKPEAKKPATATEALKDKMKKAAAEPVAEQPKQPEAPKQETAPEQPQAPAPQPATKLASPSEIAAQKAAEQNKQASTSHLDEPPMV